MADSLAGKRILVVEDEYFIASDLKRALDREEAVVVGPVATADKGLTIIAEEAIDVAVLDVNLEGSDSFRIADRLAERAVPFMFLTGYDSWSLPEAYREAPRVSKPFAMHMVVQMIARLVEENGA